MNTACPALADIGNARYSIGASRDLIGVEPDLVRFGLISRTNAPDYFADLTVFAIGDIDPSAVLVARSAPQAQDDAGPYRLLFAFRGNTDPAWPALCRYLTAELRAAQPECDPEPEPAP